MRRKSKPIDTMMRSRYQPSRGPSRSLTGMRVRVHIHWPRIAVLLSLLFAVGMGIVILARLINYRLARQEYVPYTAPPDATEAQMVYSPTSAPEPPAATAVTSMIVQPTVAPLSTSKPYVSEWVEIEHGCVV